MGRNKSLSENERQKICQMLGENINVIEIAKHLHRDTRTVKKAIQNINFQRKPRSDKGKSLVSVREKRKLCRTMRQQPLLTSKQVFAESGLTVESRATRCRILRTVAKTMKPLRTPPLSARHKQQRLQWAKQYMKCDFSYVMFTDECRATLDGPDGWTRGWILHDQLAPHRLRRQQGGGGVMFWAAIVGNSLVGPFKVPDGVKMNSETYQQFLSDNFLPWYKSQSRAFKRKCLFMQDNAPSHASGATKQFLASKNIGDNKLMEWPPASPDLNCIENLWAIVKQDIYKNGKQFSSKVQLWEAIEAACKAIPKSTIETLTKSMDDRVLLVWQKSGGHIGK